MEVGFSYDSAYLNVLVKDNVFVCYNKKEL